MANVDPSAIDDRLYRHLVESVRDYAIFLLDPSGIISSWNLGAQRLKQYRAEEIVGRHFSVFYPPELVAAGWPDEELRRATADGRFEDEGWRLRQDGSRFWANVVITAIRDESGHTIGFSKVTRDLSERRLHEERLRESEESLRMIVDGVRGHALFLLTLDGRIQSWNGGAERLLGHRTADVVGQPVGLLYQDSEQHDGRPAADLALALHAGHFKTTGWRMKADGQALWAEVSTSVLHGETGRPRALVQIVRDLSDQARLEELEAEGQRLHHFIAMLSHELRNPLAPLKNAARLIRAGGDRTELDRYAAVIERQTAHLARLVDDLLDISRIATGKIQLSPRPLDLREIAHRAADAARPAFIAKQQALSVELGPRPVPVRGDETRLTQLVDNLLNNATKFTDAGGSVVLQVMGDATEAVLTVCDNGAGMPASLLTSAFDPFVQGSHTLARSDGGLGIGLALVKRIAELHDGRVNARSGGPGQGSCFTVRLPLTREPLPQPANPAGATGAAAASTRVLVVDDNRDAAESLAALLELEGFTVRTVHDGRAALAAAQSWQPHSVVLDIGLPEMDGYQVATALRAQLADRAPHLIALTGYGQAADRERTRAAGFERHLIKPVEHAELVAALQGEAPTQAHLDATRSQR